MIQHEDTLIHHRLTHFLSTQAFLLAAAALAAKELFSKDEEHVLAWQVVIILLCVAGLLLGNIVRKSLNAAVVQIEVTSYWWATKGPDREKYNLKWWDRENLRMFPRNTDQLNEPNNKWDGEYPLIVGHVSNGSLFTRTVHVLMGIWVIVFAADLSITIMKYPHQSSAVVTQPAAGASAALPSGATPCVAPTRPAP